MYIARHAPEKLDSNSFCDLILPFLYLFRHLLDRGLRCVPLNIHRYVGALRYAGTLISVAPHGGRHQGLHNPMFAAQTPVVWAYAK